MNKVIYTAIIGDYDNLTNPRVITPGWKYVCFTDSEKLFKARKDYIWDIRMVKDSSLKSAKFARKIKICHFGFLPGFDISIWVDANIVVNCNLDLFLQKYHRVDKDFTIMKHPHRNCVYEEAEECIRRKKGFRDVIIRQIEKYRKEGFPPNQGLVASGVIVRPFNEKVNYFMKHWWEQVEKYSKRDQISFNYVLWEIPLSINLIPFQILKNEFILTKHERIK